MTAEDRIARDPTVLDPERATAGGVPVRLDAGTTIGDYVVDRHIGAGAMGDVYAGRHPVIGKRVAIKVLKPELASRSDAAERFLREARAGNRIEHPNVVDVFALGRLDDGRLYLVMDLLDGQSLRDRIAAGPVEPDRALTILAQVGDALDAAHARGVIHRDLKPDNVFLTGSGERLTAHVLDFGIARLAAEAGGERAVETLTGQGTWLGTPTYMAPEQWSADGATAASDRYALGIVAYELLTGSAPFKATTLQGLMEKHFRAAVPSVTSTGAALSPGLDRVFARALAKEPEDRHPSSAALVADLRAALAGRVRAPGGPRRAAMGAGLAAAAVVVAGGALLISSRSSHRSSASPSQPAPAAGPSAHVKVSSTPSGATVRRGAEQLGVTPLDVEVTPDTPVTLTVARPGYALATRTVTASDGQPVDLAVELAVVAGFEGVWSFPDGGFRAFERRGDQVAGFRMTAASGPREFMGFFEFVAASDGVAFTATDNHVDERAPDEPSCNIPLRAEYRYYPADDTLALRREQAQYALVDGRCVQQAVAWSEPLALARISGAPADAVWAESRAGAGQPDAPPDPDPARNALRLKDPGPAPPAQRDEQQAPDPPPGKLQKPPRNVQPNDQPNDKRAPTKKKVSPDASAKKTGTLSQADVDLAPNAPARDDRPTQVAKPSPANDNEVGQAGTPAGTTAGTTAGETPPAADPDPDELAHQQAQATQRVAPGKRPTAAKKGAAAQIKK